MIAALDRSVWIEADIRTKFICASFQIRHLLKNLNLVADLRGVLILIHLKCRISGIPDDTRSEICAAITTVPREVIVLVHVIAAVAIRPRTIPAHKCGAPGIAERGVVPSPIVTNRRVSQCAVVKSVSENRCRRAHLSYIHVIPVHGSRSGIAVLRIHADLNNPISAVPARIVHGKFKLDRVGTGARREEEAKNTENEVRGVSNHCHGYKPFSRDRIKILLSIKF